MSLLDDAKQIERDGPPEYSDIWLCCQQLVVDGHAHDCHWLSMPKIVAVLEAAERVVEMIPGNLLDHHNCDGSEFCCMGGWEARHHVYYCDGCDETAPCDCDTHPEGDRGSHLRSWARLVHHDDCPLWALASALKGDGVAK